MSRDVVFYGFNAGEHLNETFVGRRLIFLSSQKKFDLCGIDNKTPHTVLFARFVTVAMTEGQKQRAQLLRVVTAGVPLLT
jgi:hypothetical protein